jgi:hypothetical protein
MPGLVETLPAWVQAIGALITVIAAVWMWAHDRRRDRRERDGRGLSLAISLRPVLERARYRISAEFDEQAAWELFDEHADDVNAPYKILRGLPGLLNEAHLLPDDAARQVQSFWAQAQKHDTLIDRIKRARASQSSDRDNLESDLRASWTPLQDAVRSALETLEAYIKKGVGTGRDRGGT